MGKPAHVEGLVPEPGTDHLIRDQQILHIQVVGGLYVAARHFVLGKQQRTRLKHKIGNPALLPRLPNRSCLQGVIRRFDVTTCLQPPANPGMQSQEHHALSGGTDQRAGSQVGPNARPRPAVGALSKMIKVVLPQLILAVIRRRPGLKGAATVELQASCRGFSCWDCRRPRCSRP